MAAILQQPPPQNAIDGPTSPNKITYSDPSAAIFSMYTTRAQKFDEVNVKNWNGNAEGILVFTGLFSSTVATFIAMSYPNLQQDPNDITHALLRNISQQLPNANIGSAANPPITTPFVPPKSVVFINSAWFLSLVLSLTCALMATLLQQWGRRYLQTIQRDRAPHLHAHIHEYFSQGARRFHIFGLVEVVLFLLLLSVILFFAGLVVFAFRANRIVATSTAAIVGLCILSYIAFTLMPFFHHDCPYQTPVTLIIWFLTQIIPLSVFSVLYRIAKRMPSSWGMFKANMVRSFRLRYRSWAGSLSEGMMSKLEKSAKHFSMDIYKNTLLWTLRWISEDDELEEFASGIPGLYESETFAKHVNGDVQHNIRPVLAVLPGPTSSDAPLPWNIIWLARRAIASSLPKPIQQRRTRACLRALYYIPGAIRDVLAPYAAGEHYCPEILPLLNSPESLEIIEGLWDSPNEDVALSVRCAAAVVAAFMITPPHRTLDNFVTGNIQFIWQHPAGKPFLQNRLRVGASEDSARLQNVVCFLEDIKNTLQYMGTQWWVSDNADPIHQERRTLFETRHTKEYRTGRGTFDQQGDRASAAFVPAAQQDLITLTLEILARDPVAGAATPQREAFRDACAQLTQVAAEQARVQAHVLPGLTLENLARTQVQAADSIGMVMRALEPVLQSLGLSTDEALAPHDDQPSQILAPQAPLAGPTTTNSTDDGLISAHVQFANYSEPPPQPTEAIPSLQYSESPPPAWPSPATGEPGPSKPAWALV